MPETRILRPLPQEKRKDPIIRERVKCIRNLLNELWDNEDLRREMTFAQFLLRLNLGENDYIEAIESTLKKDKVFLRRRPSEIKINGYNIPTMRLWKANHDIQFVLDPIACIQYISE